MKPPIEVTDANNNDFVIKLMCAIGLQVPATSHPERALAEVAKEHNLLGDKATTTDLEVPYRIYLHTQWHSRIPPSCPPKLPALPGMGGA